MVCGVWLRMDIQKDTWVWYWPHMPTIERKGKRKVGVPPPTRIRHARSPYINRDIIMQHQRLPFGRWGLYCLSQCLN